ncbi:MAG: YbhB/YbcL family Raf kinase inhibitor-like protein [Myxococcota bacterium]
MALSLSFLIGACAGAPDSTTMPDAFPLDDQVDAPNTIDVTSRDFTDGAALDVEFSYDQFGCVGQNAAPQLAWTGAPEGTKSYAIIAHDPDAPTGVGFFHWVLIDVPATTTAIDGALPEGARALHTDYGTTGYGGPCPPPGPAHRYAFTVYALDVPGLELPDGATGALTRFVLRDHTLAQGRIVGTFGR